MLLSINRPYQSGIIQYIVLHDIPCACALWLFTCILFPKLHTSKTQVMNFSVKITFFNDVHVMEGLLLLWLKLKLSFLFTFGNLWL